MGIGAYGINNEEQKAVTIDGLDMDELDVELLERDIVNALPDSFVDETNRDLRDDEHKILASNGLFSVQTIGWEHDIGLRVKIRDDEYWNLAAANLDSTAEKLFRRLAGRYELRVKTSGYTTGPYSVKIAQP